MALRLSTEGNRFFMEDTVAGYTVLQGNRSSVSADRNANDVIIINIDGHTPALATGYAPYVYTDFVDGNAADIPFASADALMTWFNTNTGHYSGV